MEAIFSERGFRTETTDVGSVMEQLRVLIGGYGNAAVLASETAWRLINLLAPQRSQRIIKEIRMAGLNFSGDDERELARRLSAVPSLSQQLTQTLLQLEGGLQIQKPEKPTFHSLIQELYDRGLLLRGKSVRCIRCKSKLWFPLESLSKPLHCYCCNSITVLPVAPSTQAEDAYRLNELLVQAVDQGLIAMLLTMRVLWEQWFFGRRLIPSLLVYQQDALRPLLEADIAFTLGRTLGLCEVKTEQPFDLDQANGIIGLAEAMRADLVVFSTMKQRGARLPILILTRNTLLGSDVPQLSKAYRTAYLGDSKKAVFVL